MGPQRKLNDALDGCAFKPGEVEVGGWVGHVDGLTMLARNGVM